MANINNAKKTLNDFISEYVTKSLSEREKRVALLRKQDVFGMGGNENTYKEIGIIEGKSTETIRQITSKAKRKVEHNLYMISQKMKDPHVIVKTVNNENSDNLPMRQKYIYDFGQLSTRTLNCLSWEGLLLIDDILNKTAADLLKTPNFGRHSLNELVDVLKSNGLKLRSPAESIGTHSSLAYKLENSYG